jgi:hypothetical protein
VECELQEIDKAKGLYAAAARSDKNLQIRSNF